MIRMKRLVSTAVVVLSLVTCVVLPARPAAACNATSCVGQVLLVYNSSPYTYIELSDKSNLPCPLYSGRYFRLAKTSAIYNDVNSAALIALTTGARLQLRMVPGAPVCTVQYSVLFADGPTTAAAGYTRELSDAVDDITDPESLDPKGVKEHK